MLGALLCLGSLAAARAQTVTNTTTTDVANLLGDIGLSSNPTNWAAAPFVGFKSGQTAIGIVAIENVYKGVGVIGGVDTLFGGGKVGSANIVSGGVTLQVPLHPLQFLGLTGWPSNLVATPYGIAMVGTPIRGTGGADGGLASITRAGAEVDLFTWKQFKFGPAVDYGRRSGSGNYNGNWVDVVITGRINF